MQSGALDKRAETAPDATGPATPRASAPAVDAAPASAPAPQTRRFGWDDYCCPRCRSPLRVDDARGASCRQIACALNKPGSFPVIDGIPVLIDFDNSVVDRRSLVERAGESVFPRDPSKLVVAIRQLVNGDNPVAGDNARAFLDALMQSVETGHKPTLLVVGGGHIGANLSQLYEAGSIDIVCFDIYTSALTDFVADAHHIPLLDETVDGVWIQAVLEHVLSPEQVVAEIHRVLTPRGVVYAETPFMQQVHEGAYDFTRFTRSGHRWLFRRFEEIGAGVVMGAGTSLLWSIRYFWRSLTGSNQAATLLTLPLFWLRYLDRQGASGRIADAASGLYFLGRKSASSLTPRDIIDYYR